MLCLWAVYVVCLKPVITLSWHASELTVHEIGFRVSRMIRKYR